MSLTKHEEALEVARSLLEEIEISRIDALAAARRAMRLTRLTDDADAADWLFAELQGYASPGGTLDANLANWAYLSGRVALPSEAGANWVLWKSGRNERANPASLSRLLLVFETAAPHLGPDTIGKTGGIELFREVVAARRILEDVRTAIHLWAGGIHHRLRFGAAVETAFEVVRQEVDGSINQLVPDALPKLTAAFENATSANPEDWASAAATCRRLLKAAADALRPPGPPVGDHAMDADHYINRLVAWLRDQEFSETSRKFIEADLQYLDNRLRAAAKAGHKGAHDEVTRVEASRYVTGTYLVLGDILRLRGEQTL